MKTLCIYHSRDLDGWSSAAIVKLAMRNNVSAIIDLDKGTTEIAPPEEDQNQGTLYFKGYDYGQSIPDTSEYDRVIMCDISFPKEDMLKINEQLGVNFIWIDHHQRQIDMINPYLEEHGLPMDGLITEPGELRAACELTWEYFFPDDAMPELIRLLGRYDCFGHRGTEEEQTVLQFQYGARGAMVNYEDVYSILIMPAELQDTFIWETLEQGKGIYRYLCAEAKATYAKAFPLKFINPALTTEDVFIPKFLAVNQERFNPINLGIDYHADGYDGFACFWYNDGKWIFSLYNHNGKIDCAEICAMFGGGGHKGAAGFVTTDINQFLNI